jgi:shikimate dehydrogenase
MDTGGSTRVYALLGDPVAHSLSPAMQNAAFRALGLDAVYVALRCSEPSLGGIMEALLRQGGGGNVTVPHKEAAAAALSARGGCDLPVCNTFWSENGVARCAETDSEGILAALARLGSPAGPWCLIGTGGSARAAVRAALRAGVGIAVRSRSTERAARLRAAAAESGVSAVDPTACPVIINCTPLGLTEADPLPVHPGDVPAARAALDLVYRRGETEWVRAMRAAGSVAADGREALVEQGAAAFERWYPKRPAPREVMRAAVRAALA